MNTARDIARCGTHQYNPEDYVMIRRWGRMLGSHAWYVYNEQAQAAKDNAPLDAIYKRGDLWYRARHVENMATRERIGLPPYAPVDD